MSLLFSQKPNHYFNEDVLTIIYEMDTNKTELTIFLPFLQELMQKCNIGKGYWTFLEIIYPQIDYYKSPPPKKTYALCNNSSPLFLYDFIVLKNRIKRAIDPDKLPYIDEFKRNSAPLHSENILDPVFTIWPFKTYTEDDIHHALSLKSAMFDHYKESSINDSDYIQWPLKEFIKTNENHEWMPLPDFTISRYEGLSLNALKILSQIFKKDNEDTGNTVFSPPKDFLVDHFRVDTKNIHCHATNHTELIKALFDDDFELKKEYNDICVYTQYLVDKFY